MQKDYNKKNEISIKLFIEFLVKERIMIRKTTILLQLSQFIMSKFAYRDKINWFNQQNEKKTYKYIQVVFQLCYKRGYQLPS